MREASILYLVISKFSGVDLARTVQICLLDADLSPTRPFDITEIKQRH
jgi:hypothetical protein